VMLGNEHMLHALRCSHFAYDTVHVFTKSDTTIVVGNEQTCIVVFILDHTQTCLVSMNFILRQKCMYVIYGC
jgi:hypothetical protein